MGFGFTGGQEIWVILSTINMDLDSRSMQMDIVDKTEPVSNARNIGFGLGMAMGPFIRNNSYLLSI